MSRNFTWEHVSIWLIKIVQIKISQLFEFVKEKKNLNQ